jgi:hypothetical protein
MVNFKGDMAHAEVRFVYQDELKDVVYGVLSYSALAKPEVIVGLNTNMDLEREEDTKRTLLDIFNTEAADWGQEMQVILCKGHGPIYCPFPPPPTRAVTAKLASVPGSGATSAISSVEPG